jgi:excinuclease ABC subunit A
MPETAISALDPKDFVIIQGARVHNLKNIDVAIPRGKFVVITGLSGSGKSSLAFDTLYAEGQRRYVESLSAYARQFLGRLDKPDVDNIIGISPAVAIEQKVITRNPRSTVGTNTEIYDYLKLLFSRIGKTISPISGKEVKRHSVTDVVDFANSFPKDAKAIMYAPLATKEDRTRAKQLEILLQQGYTRIRYKNEPYQIEDALKEGIDDNGAIEIVIDRFMINPNDDENNSRIADSAQIAFFEGNGECIFEVFDKKGSKRQQFSNRFELDGMSFDEPNTHFFSFNSPIGACKACEGFGSVIGVDIDLVIPDKSLSVYEGAIVCWKGEKMGKWMERLAMMADRFDFPIHRPYHELTAKQKELLWTGNKHFDGLNAFFEMLRANSYKIQYRVMLSRYRGKTKCPDCEGSRLRKDANYVKIADTSITDVALMPVKDSAVFFDNLKLSEHDKTVAKRLLIEITSRLQYLNEVGLGYLTLMRLSNSLSGGESQRINLATSLGSSLVGSLYILDEPSIGLHPRDTQRLIKILRSLQQLGNTVIVVEHEEEIMMAADQVIDLGPLAGSHGGHIVFQGDHAAMLTSEESMTAKYLTGREKIEVPQSRRKWKDFVEVHGARENNLKNISVKFPLHCMTVVTGVSGSGKSTLVRQVLYPALRKALGTYGDKTGEFDGLDGSTSKIKSIEFIDQNPIGKSSRSNPVTYVKAFDEIRTLFSRQQLSKINGYKPSSFSFNVAGGRCETCEGEGQVTIEMQFMADIHLKCEACDGRRFKDEVIAVTFKEKSIHDVLQMTVDEALEFFETQGARKGAPELKIVDKLRPLQEVGLGYVKLGQASSTLSGGEAQRIKLASFLGKGGNQPHTLFIFDEPTTGLHFHDIKKLLYALNALIKQGHSVLIVEHDPDVIKNADWVIDLGPEGGVDGGALVFEGTPEDLVKCEGSYTAEFVADKLRG